MSIQRSMRRRAEREKQKKRSANPDEWTVEEAAKKAGVKVDSLVKWQEAWEKGLTESMGQKMLDILWDAENYIAAANVIISLYAVKLTFGGLKTVQKGMNRLVRNLGPAMDYVDKVGIKTAYDEITAEYGINALEFEDFDINQLFQNPGKAKLTIQKIADKVEEQE